MQEKKRFTRIVMSRARTGCVTCKEKRLKCDEAKPECLRCIKAKRKCGGYVPFILWAAGPSEKKEERRSFQFFCEKSLLQLSGTYTIPFWRKLVLQVSQAEPAIKHMLLAISSLHESIEFEGDSPDFSLGSRRIFAIQQQNKAIRTLTSTENKPTFELTVLSCLLFFVFDSLQGHFVSASKHLLSGITMLRDQQYLKSPVVHQARSPILDGNLLEGVSDMFARLDVQLATYTESQPPHPTDASTTVSHISSVPELRPSFTSPEDARASLDTIIQYASWVVDANQGPLSGSTKDMFLSNMKKLISQWKRSFDTFLQEYPSDPTDSVNLPIISMEIHYLLTFLMMETFQSETEMIYDRFTSTFEKMIELAELQNTHHKPRSGQRFVYRLDPGSMGPLFYIITHCREPQIRRRALHLLQDNHYIQGLWDSVATSLSLEKMMNIEEEGRVVESCQDIPESARVRKIFAFFDPKLQCITLRFAHYPYDTLNTVFDDYSIPWIPKHVSTSSLTTAEAVPKAAR